MTKTIQPYVLRLLSSNIVRDSKRKAFRLQRKLLKRSARLTVFLKIDDPYSYLLLQALPSLEQRFKVIFKLHVISAVPEDMFPEPELWAQHALVDANHVASLYNLKRLPERCSTQRLQCAKHNTAFAIYLQSKINKHGSWQELIDIVEAFWGQQSEHFLASHVQAVDEVKLKSTLVENNDALTALGHYLPATVYFEGEWYWGVDRLFHLEQRLIKDNLANTPTTAIVFDRSLQDSHFNSRVTAFPDNKEKINTTAAPIELFWSARSPYSYIALYKAIHAANSYKVPLDVKPVLPMMMRGLNVPRKKALYIFLDTKREAQHLGIKYGFVADPLGSAVERCYALLDFARRNNRYLEYLLAFSEGVNAMGVRADTDKGMKRIVERAGLNWHDAKCHLNDSQWKNEVVSNQKEMYDCGNWGVPVFRYQDTTVWGQDRMFVIEKKLQESRRH